MSCEQNQVFLEYNYDLMDDAIKTLKNNICLLELAQNQDKTSVMEDSANAIHAAIKLYLQSLSRLQLD